MRYPYCSTSTSTNTWKFDGKKQNVAVRVRGYLSTLYSAPCGDRPQASEFDGFEVALSHGSGAATPADGLLNKGSLQKEGSRFRLTEKSDSCTCTSAGTRP